MFRSLNKFRNESEKTAELEQPQRVVNIIGMAQNARFLPQFGENWGINHCMIHTDKLDKWFIMDGVEAMYKASINMGQEVKELIDFIKANPDMEIISSYAENFSWAGEVVAITKEYPIHLATGLIPGIFMNSSITMMMAYACLQEEMGNQKVDLINLYGIELWASSSEDEYFYQKECLDFWIAYCYGHGIQINVPAYLLYAKDTKSNLYGFYREDRSSILRKGGK